MGKFPQGFMVGASTAAHQVEGNNVHSDYWLQENVEHSQFVEPSGEAVDHYHRYEEDIRLMAEAAAKMVRDSVSAYVQRNLELARRVMCADDTVDAMFDKIKQELVDFISKRESTNADQAIDLIMIAKYLERIGDHATNIAEWVEFSITGTHASLAQL